MPEGARHLPGWPRALSEPLAAAYVGLSPSAFRSAVAPKVPAIRPSPGRVAWLRDDLDAYLDDCRDARHAGVPEEAPDDAELRALAARLAAPAAPARRRKAPR